MYSILKIKFHNNFHKFIALSLIIHVFIIISLSIKWYTNKKQSTKAIDITIVNQKSQTSNNQFDFLAQENQIAGGNHHKKNAPTVDKKAIFPDTQDVDIKKTDINKTIINDLDKRINKKEHIITSKNKNTNKNQADTTINNSDEQEPNNADFVFQVETVPELTSLLRNIDIRRKLYAKRPKVKYVSASTKKFRDAEYLDQWRRRIEYYGNKYYPQQARLHNLSGKVIVLVSINAKGEINHINIEKSSGHQILDEAAVQTLYLAAPFAEFTTKMQKDTDVLEIIRTWSFNENGKTDNLAVS